MGELKTLFRVHSCYIAPELTASAMDFSGVEPLWLVCYWSQCALGQEMHSSIRLLLLFI